jgi:hypothetical protein
MRRLILTTATLTGLALAGAGWASAQAPAKAHDAHEAHHEAAPGGGMCPMMGGGGMAAMGGGVGTMMGMGGADTQVVVKNTERGVTITLTASDPAKIVRLQKMAEGLRLMHEATSL